MPEHVHVHAPHELTESHDGHGGDGEISRQERAFELLAVLLLSLATVCIAWSGYQAARWSGIQARNYAQASTARALANRTSTLGGQERIQDLLNFNRWLDASTSGNMQLADLYERRFREEFRPAFETWRTGDALNSDTALASPLLEPNYKLANFEKADALERSADRHFEAGKEATEHADQYIFATVFFAAVLFFSGISMRFKWKLMRSIVLLLALSCFVYGGVKLFSLPTH